MRSDKARKFTDKELAEIERELNKLYANASKSVGVSYKEYMRLVDDKTATYIDVYVDAIQNGSKSDIKDAKNKLEKAIYAETFGSKKYKAITEKTASEITAVNVAAVTIATAKMSGIYIKNYNQASEKANKLGLDFSQVHKNTLKEHLKKAKVKAMKERKINITRDKRWNIKKMNSEVIKGIKQGESMSKIADRLFPIIDKKTSYKNLSEIERKALLEKNKRSAIRNARTMTTQAENAARLESYFELERQGAIEKKRWIAVGDERTRESHLLIDGETVNPEEAFSNGLMFPSDPAGDADEVWNCRCSMEDITLGFIDDEGNVHFVYRSLHEDTSHRREIDDEIQRRIEKRRGKSA